MYSIIEHPESLQHMIQSQKEHATCGRTVQSYILLAALSWAGVTEDSFFEFYVCDDFDLVALMSFWSAP